MHHTKHQRSRMARQVKKEATDTSTEEKIKNAARVVFHKKGFAATRTRDIAEEAGMNLALLNYYFQSKQKLFEIIMMETLQTFFLSVAQVFNDERSTLETKVEIICSRYIDLLMEQPEIPLFILNELRMNPQGFVKKMRPDKLVMNSHFAWQYQEAVKKGKIVPQTSILHFVMNIVGLTVFPFVGSPMFRALGGMTDDQFNKLMIERKTLIPKWIKVMLKAK